MATMALPYDLEDVVGTALADVLPAVLHALGVHLVTGTVLAGSALLMAGLAEAVWDRMFQGRPMGGVEFPGAVELVLGVLFGFFAGLATSFGFFYGAFLIGLAIYFYKAEMPHPYVWAAEQWWP